MNSLYWRARAGLIAFGVGNACVTPSYVNESGFVDGTASKNVRSPALE